MTDEERAVFQAVAASVKKWELDGWVTVTVVPKTSTVITKAPSGRVYAVMVEDVSDEWATE